MEENIQEVVTSQFGHKILFDGYLMISDIKILTR